MEEGEGRGGREGEGRGGREGRGRGGLPLSRSEKFLVEALLQSGGDGDPERRRWACTGAIPCKDLYTITQILILE